MNNKFIALALALERAEFLGVGFVDLYLACLTRQILVQTLSGKAFLGIYLHFRSAYKSNVGEYYIIYHISL